MFVALTRSTGFVGTHVLGKLLDRGRNCRPSSETKRKRRSSQRRRKGGGRPTDAALLQAQSSLEDEKRSKGIIR